MTYNRMEAKPIAGEHCRFCGDAKAPFIGKNLSRLLDFSRIIAATEGFKA